MSIKRWPQRERPREKLLSRGAEALSDAELLAIFLRTGSVGISAVDLARELLNDFGSIGPLLNADLKRFCDGRGLGVAKYCQLQAVIELAKRHLAEQLKRETVFSSSCDVKNYLSAQLRLSEQEVFAVLFLDSQHRLIAFEKLFHGTIDGASVHPREVVKKSLHFNAAAVILAHNHPSGVAEPSAADGEITRKLVVALELVDVRVLDHIVVGGGNTVSLAERGLLHGGQMVFPD